MNGYAMTDAAGLQPFQTGVQSPLWKAGEPAEIEVPERNLAETLIASAESGPDRPAMHYYGATYSYGRLLEDVERLAGHLAAHGVRAGDRVMLAMQNTPQFIIGFYGILRANAVVVPVNPMYVTEEIAYNAGDCGARVAIVGEELLERFLPLRGSHFDHIVRARYADMAGEDIGIALPEVMTAPPVPPVPGCMDLKDALAEGRAAPPVTAGRGDLAIMPYSSGTTGRAKACMHSHGGSVFVAAAQVRWYELDRNSVMSSFMPLFHVAGMMASMAAAIYAGASLVLMTRWDADAVPTLFRRHRVTWWSAAPTMVIDVLGSKSFTEDCFTSLKVVTGGGASMPAAVAKRLEERWSLRFCEGYGLTETISATHINSLTHPKPQCLGIPIYNTHSFIADPETLRPLPRGELGELLISGPQVMEGYWQRPEETAETLVEIGGRRWLRTGDLCYVDEDGCYFIVDRLKRMISVSGFKVWPAEVEMLLYRHPAIAECAVIPAPDPRRGEVVKAVIALHPEFRDKVRKEDIIAFARTVMATYKVPRIIEFRDALPRSGTRKVDWRALQEEARKGTA